MRLAPRAGSALRRVLAVIVAIGVSGAACATGPVRFSGRAMGTGWSVTCVVPAGPVDSERVRQQVADRLEALEQVFSTYRPGSDVSRFNVATGAGWISVPLEMARVAAESRRISELTGGALDVTVQPLVQLWGFGAQRRVDSIPTPDEIASARAQVGWRWLEVRDSPPSLRKAQIPLAADFSSMAKGFAVDAVSELLSQLGWRDHLVQVGGDIRSAGCSPTQTGGWRVAIEEPREGEQVLGGVVHLSRQALSTSGDYRNFLRVGGRRYGHIIDPRTGWPAATALASVSVVHASCATSSALATALFVLGPDAGLRLAQEKGLACLFIVRGDSGWVRQATPEFESLMRGAVN